ncbi:hypothetical protein [Rhodococcus sp. ACT016]|uniref:hypothetical protein n=1 Tax=Rhodococcus sp. ACT016 TaxID=3134808 RepID=UPI003D2B1DD5
MARSNRDTSFWLSLPMQQRPDTMRRSPNRSAESIRRIGLAGGRQRWHGPIRELSAYATYPDVSVRHELVYAIANWRTPGVDDLLTRLAADVDVGESAAWILSRRRQTGRTQAQ